MKQSLPMDQMDPVAAAESISRASDMLALTKPRISTMAAITTAGGFYLGTVGSIDWLALVNTFIALWIMSGGGCAMNQYLERDRDGLMERTRNRPLPTGRMTPGAAFAQGMIMTMIGLVYMALAVNPVAAAVGAFAFISYVFVYTPLKRVTSLCTVVGAVPGALPPVIGWAAARGEVTYGAMVLFAIMFLWQLPHSLAIGYMYRDDYRRGGFRLLTVLDFGGRVAARQAVIYLIAMIFVSFIPYAVGLTGPVYLVGAFLLGLFYLSATFAWFLKVERIRARRSFFASLIYLVALFALLVGDKVG